MLLFFFWGFISYNPNNKINIEIIGHEEKIIANKAIRDFVKKEIDKNEKNELYVKITKTCQYMIDNIGFLKSQKEIEIKSLKIIPTTKCHAEISILWSLIVNKKTLSMSGTLGGKKRACKMCKLWINEMIKLFKDERFLPVTADPDRRPEGGNQEKWEPPTLNTIDDIFFEKMKKKALGTKITVNLEQVDLF
ncbi:hypothetical protein PWG14_26345 [Chromobacterium amazonense]|uniref:hypothetical protein n=1 Tax=Chromobacterium amazonense TaxID=1382803 RepID=UPI00237ED232|nr:hypothetical protein [Chromobacterium amazonense]MDE1715989.1 hypothetical protein [Chromobacterium amazonense]